MKIITEKREVVGTLKTSLGMYNLIGKPTDTRKIHLGTYADCFQFHVIDEEGFENYVWMNGGFIVVPMSIPTQMDVKVVLTDEEAQDLNKAQLFSDEPATTN